MIPIEELVPYANNAKRHSAAQISQIRASLREFGFVAPVLIDENCNIIAGHGRVEAARAEGMQTVPCVVTTGLTEAQRKAYILADNRLTEVGEWDSAMLEIELKGLTDMGFDTKLTGFEVSAGPAGSVYVNDYTRSVPGQAAPADSPDDPGSADDSEYQAFVDKFKPKKTTDDCYTPEPIYEAVRAWAVRRYALGDAPIVRPFFPGGDYENTDYPDGCVVIDNPPFSILSQICRTYMERGIRFFLFAPTLRYSARRPVRQITSQSAVRLLTRTGLVSTPRLSATWANTRSSLHPTCLTPSLRLMLLSALRGLYLFQSTVIRRMF